MGWWGYGIMDGDTPSDFKCSVQVAVVGEKVWDKINDATDDWEEQMARLDKLVDIGLRTDKTGDHKKLFAAINKETKSYRCDRPIGYQVIGVMVMAAGAKLSKDAKAKIIRACEDEDESADDFNRPGSRRRALTDLRQKIARYKGKPVKIKETGLFETMMKAIAKGQK